MPLRVDDGFLAHWATADAGKDPLAVVTQGFGQLSAWWLRWEVMEAAYACPGMPPLPRPPDCGELPGDPGCCIIPLWVDTARYPLLRPAVPLCVQWVKGEGDDPHLPGPLAEVAADVLRLASSSDQSKYHLRLAGPTADLDLSGFRATAFSSAAVPLLAALRMAQVNCSVNPRIWSTGAIGPGGIEEVDGVPAKVALAAAFGAQRMFVPARALATLEQRGSLMVSGLPADVAAAISDILSAHLVPPRRADFPSTEAFHQAIVRHYDLLTDLKLDHAAYYQQGVCPVGLVAILTGGPGLTELIIRLLQPRQTLLLHTADAERARDAQALADKLVAEGLSVRPAKISEAPEHVAPTICDRVARFRAECAGAPLVLDVSGGKTLMKLAMALHAWVPGDELVCCEPSHDRDRNRFRPFTEALHRWRAGQPWWTPV
jgi:hypothetical protein